MTKKYIFILLSLLIINKNEAQTIGLLLNSEESLNGYTLFAPNSSTTTYLINNCGEIINQWESNYRPALSVYLLENGHLLRTKRMESPANQGGSFSGGGIGGGLEEFDWEGNLIWEYNYANTLVHQHHDIEQLPNGNVLILAWEKKTIEEAENLGAIEMATQEIWPEHIIEIEKVGKNEGNIVWEWHAWDHLIQDNSPKFPNFGVVSENPQRININYKKPVLGNNPLNPNFGNGDWMHANSIDYNEDLDQIIISLRRWNEIWIIDHSTTSEEAASSYGGTYEKGGDLLYRYGNPEAYNKGDENDKKLWGQHDARWIPKNYPDGGKIMVFNNGSGGRNYSSIDVLSPPFYQEGFYELNNNGIYGPEFLDWTYMSPNPYNFYADHISGSHRLENGNTMICSGTTGHLFEVNYNGDIVWEYINPVSNTGILSQGSNPEDTGNNVFRSTRHPENYPIFQNQIISEAGPIELNPIDYMCELYNNTNIIDFQNLNKRNLIQTIDILGKNILRKKNKIIFYLYDDGSVEKKIIY